MLTVVAGLLWDNGKILIARRNATGPHPFKWEFPGGKLEAGETPEEGLRRELGEELGIEAEIGEEFARYEYSYPGKSPILLLFITVGRYFGNIQNRGMFAELAWETPDQLNRYEFLEGDLPLIQLLGEIHIDQVD